MDYKLAANLDATILFPSLFVKISFYFNKRVKNYICRCTIVTIYSPPQ